MPTVTAHEWRESFPLIPWDEPAIVSVFGAASILGEPPRRVFACRICIANFGLKAEDILNEVEGIAAWEKADDFIEHLATAH